MILAAGALAQIMAAAGVDQATAGPAAFRGDDPVLPTPFLMGTAGAAALAAVSLSAAEIWRLRGGGEQRVAMDARRGAMALRTNKYLRLDGQPLEMAWDPLSGFHRTADGWIQLHCQFPHFRDGVLRVLGCKPETEAASAALRAWRSQDFEDRMAGEGLPAFKLRSRREWRDHPQGIAVAGLPLMEIIKIGDSAPVPLPAADRPLSAIRALDLTRVIAGPTAGRTLAEYGADVMRVGAAHLPTIAPLVMDTGHGKRAADVDLREPAGHERLRDLIRGADIFSQSYRPGSLAARGFGPDDLHALRPGIICVSLSAWSHAGPWASRRGFDTLVQCATGLSDEQGAAGGPQHLPGSPLDYITGYLGAFGAMTALARRARDGGSYLVRVSLAQSANWLDNLGRTRDAAAARQVADPGCEDIADLLMTSKTPWGVLSHMKPLTDLSETPPRWDRPAVPLGTHPALWE